MTPWTGLPALLSMGILQARKMEWVSISFSRKYLIQVLYFFIRSIDLFLVALGLCCCMWAFSSYSEQGLLLIAVPGLHTVVTFFCCRAQALGTWASVVVVHRLNCSAACGIFLDQGLNTCPLHWRHCTTKEFPKYIFFKIIVLICS